jgi:hypothetical protein
MGRLFPDADRLGGISAGMGQGLDGSDWVHILKYFPSPAPVRSHNLVDYFILRSLMWMRTICGAKTRRMVL